MRRDESRHEKNEAVQPLVAEICMDCGNCMLAALNFSLLYFFKLKYYGNFTYITQIVHSNSHLNHFKGIFIDKPLIIVET